MRSILIQSTAVIPLAEPYGLSHEMKGHPACGLVARHMSSAALKDVGKHEYEDHNNARDNHGTNGLEPMLFKATT